MRVVLISLVFCFLAAVSFGQTESTAPAVNDTLPYLKYPKMPAFNIMLTDSSTIYNTFNIPAGKPTVIMFFDPGCKHCKEVTKRLVSGMDSLKDLRFCLISPTHNMSDIKQFASEYGLDKWKNVEAIGRDYEFFFMTYYGVRFFPDLVVYDEKKKLVKLFEGNVTVADLYKCIHP